MTDGRHLNSVLARPGGTVLAHRYRLTTRIGRGGMAEVFRAEDEVLHRPVAVKVFRFDTHSDEERSRVEAEVQILASMRHPGLVTVYDAGTLDGDGDATPYLVMELITGPTLARQLRDGPLARGQTERLGADVAATLGYVHAQGVVHRDVKPANILLDEPTGAHGEFSAKLSDFGIARLLDSTHVTMHGTTVGTANYLSPEQAQGRPITPASDVYSLGLVLLECLTGQVVYPGSGVPAAAARLERPPVIPARLGQGWTQLLTAMTALAPEDRPHTTEVARTLSNLDAQPAHAQPPSTTAPVAATAATAATAALAEPAGGLNATKPLPALTPPPAARRSTLTRRMLLAGAAIVAAILIVFGIAMSGGDSGGPPGLPITTPSPTSPVGTVTRTTPTPTHTTAPSTPTPTESHTKHKGKGRGGG